MEEFFGGTFESRKKRRLEHKPNKKEHLFNQIQILRMKKHYYNAHTIKFKNVKFLFQRR